VLSPHIWHNTEFVQQQMDPHAVTRREAMVGVDGENFLQRAWRRNWGKSHG